ncbi:MAG: peptidoglycan-binding protein [Rhodoblastus sp.]
MRKFPRRDLDFDLDYDDEGSAQAEPSPRRARISATRVGVFGLATLSIAIVVNAAFLQDQRRAAPLFKISLAEPGPERVAQPQTAPQPLPSLPAPRIVEAQPSPAAQSESKSESKSEFKSESKPEAPRLATGNSKIDLIAREITRNDPIARAIASVEKPAPVEKPAHAAKPASAEKHQRAAPRKETRRPDPIASLIDKQAAPSARAPQASEVIAAQRALQRLGFVIRPNGVFDATTRQAIAQFERERNMPARGELTPAIRRELARMASGEIQ